EAVLAAEGSDWFWWYGDDFTTENAPEFDALFRRNVEQVFRHIGMTPPERLARPIIAPYKDKSQAAAISLPPRRLIHPLIDGYSRSYFEWNGAGFYRPGSAAGSSMYQGGEAFSQLWYGFSLTDLYVRLDPKHGADISGELRILLTRGKDERTLRMPVDPAGAETAVLDERGAKCGSGRAGDIVELAVAVSALGLSAGERRRGLPVLSRERGDDAAGGFVAAGEGRMVAAGGSQPVSGASHRDPARARGAGPLRQHGGCGRARGGDRDSRPPQNTRGSIRRSDRKRPAGLAGADG